MQKETEARIALEGAWALLTCRKTKQREREKREREGRKWRQCEREIRPNKRAMGALRVTPLRAGKPHWEEARDTKKRNHFNDTCTSTDNAR